MFGPSPVHPLERLSAQRAGPERIARDTARLIGLGRELRDDQISRDSTVLYARLGGQPALNADSALFR